MKRSDRRAGSAKAIAAAAAAAVLVVLAAAGLYYRAIQGGHYEQIEQARRTALNETPLVRAERVWRFAGDDVYYVVAGPDGEGRPLLVWVGPESVTVHSAVYGISGEEAAERTKRRAGDAAILRTVPGMLDGEPVWEVFYERKEDGGVRRYYDYYRFSDGALLDTLRLNVEK